MLLEDVKLGMHLRDPKGNVYEVLEVLGEPKFRVYLKCIDFVQRVKVEPSFEFNKIGQTRWVYADREHFVDTENPTIQQLLQGMHILEDAYSGTRQFKVVYANHHKWFRLVTAAHNAEVEITIADMELKEQHLTRDNIRIGMRVRTALDTELIVIGYTDTLVQLLYDVTFSCKGKQLKQAAAKIYIDWADAPAIPVGSLTTNDFTIVE